MRTVLTCVGTRPNFIKVMLLKRLFQDAGYDYRLLHTGQHFDADMSAVFFRDLKLGEPDYYLGVGSGSHAEVVARIIEKSSEVLAAVKPDLVLVPGDVNSTFACAFAAASLDIPVAHIESGLRSFDTTMPEERNRILADHLSSLLYVTEPVGAENLANEGVPSNRVKIVGNTIIDALIAVMPWVDRSSVKKDLGLDNEYVLTTFHRPSNVDEPAALAHIVETLKGLSAVTACVFPVHPRTRARMESTGLLSELVKHDCKLVPPMGYMDFLALMKDAACVVSDSGGVQVECAYLNVPLVTVRDTTECQITVERGTNTLCPPKAEEVVRMVERKMRETEDRMTPRMIQGLWDGRASERVVEHAIEFLS